MVDPFQEEDDHVPAPPPGSSSTITVATSGAAARIPTSALTVIGAALLVLAVVIVLVAPPMVAVAAWVLAAVAVPALWALFFVADRRSRRAPTTRVLNERRVNQWMLMLGLVIGVWAAWVFATEVAK